MFLFIYNNLPKESRKTIHIIQKLNKFLNKYEWSHPVSGVEKLKSLIHMLYNQITPFQLNSNKIPLSKILTKHSSNIYDVYCQFLSLEDIRKIPQIELTQTTEQIVINRAIYVFNELLDDFSKHLRSIV